MGTGDLHDSGELDAILKEAITNESLISLVLSKPRRDSGQIQKLTARPVRIGDSCKYQFTSHFADRQTHENLTPEETLLRIHKLYGSAFEHLHLFAETADYSVRINKQGGSRIKRTAPSKTTENQTHNRTKNYLIPEGVPCPFLIETGVMTASGQVRSARRKKFRQINRFLELVENACKNLPPEGPLRVIDFGCGKSYLTFALHHLLHTIHQRDVKLTGLDLKQDVIDNCRQIAERLDCPGLEFHRGDISNYACDDNVHMAVSLHACDTATDAALAQAVAWNADVILAVPCCQHELATLMASESCRPVSEHGILHERFAAILTDALRAQALEICGYSTQVEEFIDMEHTAKNVLFRAVRSQKPVAEVDRAITEYRNCKQSWGLEQTFLDRALGAEFIRRVGLPTS